MSTRKTSDESAFARLLSFFDGAGREMAKLIYRVNTPDDKADVLIIEGEHTDQKQTYVVIVACGGKGVTSRLSKHAQEVGEEIAKRYPEAMASITTDNAEPTPQPFPARMGRA